MSANREQIHEGKSEKSNPIKMSKEAEIKFQVFDGRDYNIWKKRILLYLKSKKCSEPATREKLNTDPRKKTSLEELEKSNKLQCWIKA